MRAEEGTGGRALGSQRGDRLELCLKVCIRGEQAAVSCPVENVCLIHRRGGPVLCGQEVRGIGCICI